MKNTMTNLIFSLIGTISLLLAAAGSAMAQVPVKVSAYAEHYGGKLVYHYRVSNNSPYNVAVVTIGYDTKNDEDNYNDVWELFELPSQWDSDTGIPPASAELKFPTGKPRRLVIWSKTGASARITPRALYVHTDGLPNNLP